MGMVVKTNMLAMNANNALTRNNSTVAKNVEKLSTGMRINRAADDASGLAISEKMKAQIKALDTATDNAEDGISLIQTAEGYMDEIHTMLNRMVELSEKSANGTYQSKAGGGNYATYETNGASASALVASAGTDRAALQLEMDQLATEIDRIATTANFNQNKLMNGSLATNGIVLQIGETSAETDKLSVKIDSFMTKDLFGKATKTTNNKSVAAKDAGITNGKTFDISNQTNASKAAEEIRTVIDNVSMQRASLGAQQNRLEHTVNNLTTASENISSANSRIRDTDMAKEMMAYTQANVLTQAAQAMLAQANQAPQSVLQLLQ